MSEAVFAAYQQQYSYDPLPLEARTEARVEGDEWIRERVSFTAVSFLPLFVQGDARVLLVPAAGRPGSSSHPRLSGDADGLNFAPGVRTPVLMLHGRYDIQVPWETDGKPLYDLLGTPAPDKLLKMYDTDHFIPRTDLMRESLAWLDKDLGPVRR